LDALAQAGGLGEFAKTSKIYVLRRNSTGASIKLPFDYKRVSQGRDVGANNVELQAGDTVIVP
jgi:protein involved in polysaccharide export with SLBB domain